MRSLLLSVLVIAFVVVTAVGQAERADPLGCEKDSVKKLSFLIGDWQVESRFRKGPESWDETKGTSRITYLFEGCLIEEDLRIERDGRPFNVRAFYSYNNFIDKYQWMFAHSEHGMMSLFEGRYDRTKLLLEDSLSLPNRTILFQRHLKQTDVGFVLVAKRSNDGGQTWRDDWFLKYSK